MINPAKFVREVRQEAGRVNWPTRRETTISSVMVLIMAAIAAIFFLVVDLIFSHAIQWLLGI